MGDHHFAGQRIEQSVQRLVERGRVDQVGAPQAMDEDRRPVGHAARPYQLVAGVVEAQPSAVDVQGREGDDLVRGGIEPGRLEVDDAEVGLTPRGRAIGRRRLGVGAEARRGACLGHR